MPASTNNPVNVTFDPDARRKRRGSMDDIIEPLLVRPRVAAKLLGCGLTRVYELINSGILESFMDGKSRKITTNSIKTHIERQLAAKGQKRDTSTAAAKSVAARRAKNAAPWIDPTDDEVAQMFEACEPRDEPADA